MRFFIFFALLIPSFGYSQIIDRVVFTRNKKCKQKELEKVLSSPKGAIYNSEKLEEDLRRLKLLPGIANATATVDSINGYIVNYQIEENYTLIPGGNVWNAFGRLAFRLGLHDFNFLGRNIIFGGFYQNNGYHSGGIKFEAPYLFSKKLGLKFRAEIQRSLEPLYFKINKANYLFKYNDIDLVITYQFNTNNNLQVGGSFLHEYYQHQNGFFSMETPSKFELNKYLGKIVYQIEDVRPYYFYMDGWKNMTNVQYVISDHEKVQPFKIIWNDFIFYNRIGGKGNLANRTRIGFASNNESPFAPFSIDNHQNIRGVGDAIARGTAIFFNNVEYRYTLYEKGWFVLQGNIFTDFTTYRNPGEHTNKLIKSDNLVVNSGLGLRFIHKTIYDAIIRVDYGWNIVGESNNGIVVGIGQYF